MKGSQHHGSIPFPSVGNRRTSLHPGATPHSHNLIPVLIWLLASSLSGAFEGADLFRTALAGTDGIHPAAMNNPALLPEQPLYGSFGRGQPLGRSWAAFNTFSLGGRLGTWRGSAGVWTSGDELYRELSLTTALAKRLGSRLDAGLCLAYHRVTIKDFDPIKADFLIGAALNAPLSDDISVGVWYGNQPWGRKRAFQSLTRQLFQLSVNAHIGENTSWTIAAEKTPPFTLRQLVEIRHLTKRGIQLQLGYRTGPGMPYLGVQLPLLRLLLSVRVNIHPIFGLSTAFGLAFQ